MLYTSELPGVMKCGRGVRKTLSSLLPDGPVFVVCGKHGKAALNAERTALFGKRPVTVFDAMPPEPPLSAVEAARETARTGKARSIVGFGGGSAMDGAKAVAALLEFPGSVADAFYGRGKPAARTVCFAALPTTAGTGAEVTANAVLLDPETGIKQSLRTPNMAADIALTDPELLYSCPPAVTAASGFDALTQALESFLSLKANAQTRLTALGAARLLLAALPRAFTGERTAWDDMALGSLQTGCAFSVSGLGAVHGIGHPAGSIRHVPHGVCCAVLLPAVLRCNLEAARQAETELACGLGFSSPEELIGHLTALREKLGLPADFKSSGLTAADYPFIVQNCRSGSMRCNPRALSDADVTELLETLS